MGFMSMYNKYDIHDGRQNYIKLDFAHILAFWQSYNFKDGVEKIYHTIICKLGFNQIKLAQIKLWMMSSKLVLKIMQI